MDALAGATVVADPEPYVGRLVAASPCADTANDAASTSGGSRGVPLFDAAPVPPSNDEATTVKVVEDLAVFAGGAVWCLDWAPARGGAETARHVAVEARSKDDVEHNLGAIGRARGPGLVQVMALRLPAPGASGAAAARATKGKRPRDDQNPGPPVDRATANTVLGLAHDAKHAFDLKWRPADVDKKYDDDAILGHLAAALGNGRVEVWRVPSPDAVRTRCEEKETPPSRSRSEPNPVPVVKCAANFVGVVPPNAGVVLCVDWAQNKPKNRLVAGTSTGAVVLWTLPEDSDRCIGGASSREVPTPAFPVMRVASTGCPQRSIRFAPAAKDDDSNSTKHDSNSNFLVLCGGHGMGAPAVFDTRDVFSTSAGGSYSFGGNAVTTCVAFFSNGVFLSSRDDGAVDAHDFFHDARMLRPRRDTADRVARRTILHDHEHPENALVAFDANKANEKRGKAVRKKNSTSSTFVLEPALALDRGAAWSVDAKPAFDFHSKTPGEDVGCAMVLAGFGRAGTRIAFMNLGNGLRKVTGVRSGKIEARQSGFPVDLTFIGATATFSSNDEEDENETSDATTTDIADANVNGVAALLQRAEKKKTARARFDATRVSAPAHRGAGGFGFVDASAFGADVTSSATLAPKYAPVRCVRWLDPTTPVSSSPDRAWCVWGDDAGFVRFQRLCGDAVAVTARGVAEMETRN